jgi:cell division septation protein DedD
MTINTNARSWYKAVFEGWQVKLAGQQPTNDQLSHAHYFGRPGKQCMAIAMMLRDGGATASQIKQASAMFDGNPTPHFNKIRELVAGGYFERLPTPGAFTVRLTAKGNQLIKNKAANTATVTAEPAKPAKGAKVKAPAVKATSDAAKPKAVRKPKAKPVTTDHVTPQVTQAPVPEAPAAEVQPTA